MVLRLIPRAILLLALSVVGCAPWFKGESSNYQTVMADPHHDTQRAVRQNERALRLMSKGKWEEAQQALEEALVADVTYGPAHSNLGKLYYDQRKFYLAAWEFEYATGLMPDHAAPHNNLGLVFEAVGKNGDAIKVYELALSLDPQNPEIIGNLVRARMRRGDSGREIAFLLDQLILFDTRPDWVAWAHEQLVLGPVADAREEFESLPLPNDLRPPRASENVPVQLNPPTVPLLEELIPRQADGPPQLNIFDEPSPPPSAFERRIISDTQ